MGELADHIQLQNERNAKRRLLQARMEGITADITRLRILNVFVFEQWQNLNRQLEYAFKQLKETQAMLDQLDLDEAPLQNRPQPETHRGVSID